MAMNDGLRQARRARGVEDPQGMIERDLDEVERFAPLPELHPILCSRDAFPVSSVGDYGRRNAGNRVPHGLYHSSPVEPLPAIAVPLDPDEDLGGDLLEPVYHASRPKVRT